jgi:hypothetical protein
MTATWQPKNWHCDMLVAENGDAIAYVEDFGYAAYPMAINATGNWERGGAFCDRVAAMQWAERVAGLHPAKPGDERPPFYYSREP